MHPYRAGNHPLGYPVPSSLEETVETNRPFRTTAHPYHIAPESSTRAPGASISER
jgi:hypothetical protein